MTTAISPGSWCSDIVALARQANRAFDGTFITDWQFRSVTATKEG